VNGALELLHRSMPKNIDIAVHLEPNLPVTNADPAQIQQVIINLAVNARDAMPEGGKMAIETSAVAEEGPKGARPPARQVRSSDFRSPIPAAG